MLTKIISGGQTGADQAALDAAIEMGIPHGGWIPKGRLTEAGPLPEKYNLQEMPSKDYLKRTQQNVLDSDGTLFFSHGDLTGGSKGISVQMWFGIFAEPLSVVRIRELSLRQGDLLRKPENKQHELVPLLLILWMFKL